MIGWTSGSTSSTMRAVSSRVEVRRRAHVAHVEMTREDKRNGLDLSMFEALIAAAESLRADRSVRAVVLSGRGKAFCAGLDWASFMSLGPEVMARMLDRAPGQDANYAQRVCWIWQELEVPVIAAIRGAAIGGGLQLALAADLRYVAPDAELSLMEIRYGLIPDMSVTQTLPRLVRADVARELVWTGRKVDAAEAVAIGLATRVVDDPLAAAMETATTIAARSPEAIRAGKRLFSRAHDLDVRAALALEEELQRGLLGRPNQIAAVTAAMMKQEPVFEDA